MILPLQIPIPSLFLYIYLIYRIQNLLLNIIKDILTFETIYNYLEFEFLQLLQYFGFTFKEALQIKVFITFYTLYRLINFFKY